MPRIYVWKELRPNGVPYVRKHVTTLERLGEFPMHFNLGPNRVGWMADEVDAWVEQRVRNRRIVSTPATAEIPQFPRPRASRTEDPADARCTAEIARMLAQEAARRGLTTIELIRQIIVTHDGAARTTRRRSAAEPALNT